jgi:hypothetical protein
VRNGNNNVIGEGEVGQITVRLEQMMERFGRVRTTTDEVRVVRA